MRPKDIEAIVNERAFEQLPIERSERSVVSRGFFRLLPREGEVIAWRAAEGLGLWLSLLNDENHEFTRDALRRLNWSLAEEAGAAPWMSGEAIGEIALHSPEEGRPFVAPAFNACLQSTPRGALWLLGRLGAKHLEWFQGLVPQAFVLLDSDRSMLRGHAAWAFSNLIVHNAPIDDGLRKSISERLGELSDDNEEFKIYRGGDLQTYSVASQAKPG